MRNQSKNNTNTDQIQAIRKIISWYRSVIMLKTTIEMLNVDYATFEEKHHEKGLDNVELDIINRLHFIGLHISLKKTFTVPYLDGSPHITSLLHLACELSMPRLVSFLLNKHNFKAHMTLPQAQHLTPLFHNLNHKGFKIRNIHRLRGKVYEITALLISNGALLISSGDDLKTHIGNAVWYGFFHSAQLLLEAAPQLSPTVDGIGMLAREGDAYWLRRLLPFFTSKNNNVINTPFWKVPVMPPISQAAIKGEFGCCSNHRFSKTLGGT